MSQLFTTKYGEYYKKKVGKCAWEGNDVGVTLLLFRGKYCKRVMNNLCGK